MRLSAFLLSVLWTLTAEEDASAGRSRDLIAQNSNTRLLEEHSYVRCLLIDFSKAFDVVDHDILVSKLSQLPPCILQWISSFLTLEPSKLNTPLICRLSYL